MTENRDRKRGNFEQLQNKKSTYFWIALAFLLPGIMGLFMLVNFTASMGTIPAPLAIIAVGAVVIGLVVGKLYLDAAKELRRLDDS